MTEEGKIILGIDPGTNILGYGVIRVAHRRPEYIGMGVLDLRSETGHFAKLKALSLGVSDLMDRFSPDYLSIESPFCGKNPQVMLKLGRAQGAAITAALTRGVPVVEYAPRKAKISITGNGSASKEQVCSMIQKLMDVTLDPEFLDATDALALAVCHYFNLSNPLSSAKTSTDWKKFIENNPGRIKK